MALERPNHQQYIQRALDLALLGLGTATPNPMVGCVIVHEDKIIGEGYHQYYGGPHAEVNAINSVANKNLLASSTFYVTLEPCCHHGKTPPCASLLLEVGAKKVVIANRDPNPLVSGGGIKVLEDQGVEVITGVLEEEAKALNKRFLTFINKKRPYVILKWAQTLDGFVARSNYDSKWISNIYARTLVHQWRSEEASILVGRHTAMQDNPKLNTRLWEGKSPTRIVFDRFLKLPNTLHLFDQSHPTICYNTIKDEKQNNMDFVKLPEKGFILKALEDLHQRKIKSMIIEGGAQVLHHFMDEDLWDEARVFIAPHFFEEGIKAPLVKGKLVSDTDIIGNKLQIWLNE